MIIMLIRLSSMHPTALRLLSATLRQMRRSSSTTITRWEGKIFRLGGAAAILAFSLQNNAMSILRDHSGLVDFDGGFSNSQSVNNMIRVSGDHCCSHYLHEHHDHHGQHDFDHYHDRDHQMSEGRKVRLLLDWSSAEIFIDNGLYAMTSRWRWSWWSFWSW